MTKKIFTTIILTIILFCGLLAGSIYLTRHLTAKADSNIEQLEPEEPHEHEYGEWEIVKNATCIENGEENRTCACGENEIRTIAALGHEYGETITAPTCTEKGYTIHTCSRCNDTYKDNEVNALGHKYGEWTIKIAPTITTEGLRTRTCIECGAEDSEKLPCLESYAGYWLYDIEDAGTWVIRMTETTFEIAEATKVDSKYQLSGAYEFLALNSNETVGTHINLYVSEDNEVLLYYDTATNLLVYGGMNATRIAEEDVLEHTHNMQLIRTEGTECIGTTSYYKCSDCGHEETITSLGIGHSFDQISIGGGNVERIPATCTSPAYDKEKCTHEGCNEYLLTPVEGSSALGHDYGEWVIDSTKNIVAKTCSRCADKVTKEFEIPSSFYGWYKVPEINLLEGVGGNLIFIDNSNNFKIASIHEFENIYDITGYELITKYSIKYVDDKLELVLEDYGAYAELQNNSLKTLKFNLNTQQLCFEFSAEEIYYSEKISDKYVYVEQYFYKDGDRLKGVLYNVEHALFGKYEAETRDGKEKHYFYFTPSEFSEITADGEVIKTFNKLSSIDIYDNNSMTFQFLEEKDSRTNTGIMFGSDGEINLIMDDTAYYSVTKINS